MQGPPIVHQADAYRVLMTSSLKIAAITAAVALSTVLVGCSSTSSADSSSASPAASSESASATGSTEPSASGSTEVSASPIPSLTIPDDVITEFLRVSCVASTAVGGGSGKWDDTALACTTPDGTVTKSDSAKEALSQPGTRAMFVYTTYTKKIATELPGCPTLAELEAARNSAAPATTDACIESTLKAVSAYLAKQ